MALERKDIRAKLDQDVHASLVVLAEVDGIDLCEFIERELLLVIRKRIHDAMVIAEHARRQGISGSARES